MRALIVRASLAMLVLSFGVAHAKDGVVEINGVVQSMPASGLVGAWTIAGRSVRTDAATVIKQQIAPVAVGAVVEAKGSDEGGGVTLATVIEVKQGVPPGGTTPPPAVGTGAEIVGNIEALPASGLLGTWRVAGRDVIVGSSTILDSEHGAFAVGVSVEAKGTGNAAGALVASRVERVAGNGAPVPPLKFWGTVETLPSTAGFVGAWRVSGRSVNVTASTALRVNNGPIVVGAIVEVDGWLQPDASVEAHEIETRTSMGAIDGQGPLAIEYHNAALGHYFMTAFPDEIALLDGGAFGGAWKRTGESFRTGGVAAACRFYGAPPKGPDSHFFTSDASECEHVMVTWASWTYEAHAFSTTPAAGGACAAGLVAVRRFYNNPSSGAAMNHRYVTSAAVAAEMRGKGWIDEGVVMCAPA